MTFSRFAHRFSLPLYGGGGGQGLRSTAQNTPLNRSVSLSLDTTTRKRRRPDGVNITVSIPADNHGWIGLLHSVENKTHTTRRKRKHAPQAQPNKHPRGLSTTAPNNITYSHAKTNDQNDVCLKQRKTGSNACFLTPEETGNIQCATHESVQRGSQQRHDASADQNKARDLEVHSNLERTGYTGVHLPDFGTGIICIVLDSIIQFRRPPRRKTQTAPTELIAQAQEPKEKTAKNC